MVATVEIAGQENYPEQHTNQESLLEISQLGPQTHVWISFLFLATFLSIISFSLSLLCHVMFLSSPPAVRATDCGRHMCHDEEIQIQAHDSDPGAPL